jgi:hypothetical protein
MAWPFCGLVMAYGFILLCVEPFRQCTIVRITSMFAEGGGGFFPGERATWRMEHDLPFRNACDISGLWRRPVEIEHLLGARHKKHG